MMSDDQGSPYRTAPCTFSFDTTAASRLTTVKTRCSDSDIRNKLIWGLAADTTKEFLRYFQTFLEDLVSHHWKK